MQTGAGPAGEVEEAETKQGKDVESKVVVEVANGRPPELDQEEVNRRYEGKSEMIRRKGTDVLQSLYSNMLS